MGQIKALKKINKVDKSVKVASQILNLDSLLVLLQDNPESFGKTLHDIVLPLYV